MRRLGLFLGSRWGELVVAGCCWWLQKQVVLLKKRVMVLKMGVGVEKRRWSSKTGCGSRKRMLVVQKRVLVSKTGGGC
jgi:hypothetical protein